MCRVVVVRADVNTTDDMDLFNTINNKLLKPPGVTIRHVPIKIYLPMSASQGTSQTIPESAAEDDDAAAAGKAGHIRVVQSLVPLNLPSKQPQTLGTALNSFAKHLPEQKIPITGSTGSAWCSCAYERQSRGVGQSGELW
jgi:hypothetical protein